MDAIIEKFDNTLAIRIPIDLANKIKLTEGSKVQLSVDDGSLIIKPIKQKIYLLSELVDGITIDNLHNSDS